MNFFRIRYIGLEISVLEDQGDGAGNVARHVKNPAIPPTPRIPAAHEHIKGGSPRSRHPFKAGTDAPTSNPSPSMQAAKVTGPESAGLIKHINVITKRRLQAVFVVFVIYLFKYIVNL